jgi:hypothetical protein
LPRPKSEPPKYLNFQINNSFFYKKIHYNLFFLFLQEGLDDSEEEEDASDDSGSGDDSDDGDVEILNAKRQTADNLPMSPGEWQAEIPKSKKKSSGKEPSRPANKKPKAPAVSTGT